MATSSLHLLHDYFYRIRSYFEDHPDHETVADLGVFRDSAEWARRHAADRGELEALQAAIDFALAKENHDLDVQFDLSLAEIIHDDEGYRDTDVLKEILRYYRSVIWPDSPPPRTDFEIVSTHLDEWRQERATRDGRCPPA
jgi:hypothetical protein